MRVIGVVVLDPLFQRFFQFKWEIPFAGPDKVLFDRAHDTFGIGIVLGIVPGGKYLLDAERSTGFHERF